MSKLAHSNQETMDIIEAQKEERPDMEPAIPVAQEVLPPIEIDTCGSSLPMIIESRSVMSFFKPTGLDPIIEKIKADVKSMNLDISTTKGRDEIRSVARKIASAKVKLDDAGKDLVASLKAQTGAIDAERKRMRDDLDAFKEEVRKPLTEWEDKEKSRIDGHEQTLLEIIKPSEFEENLTVEQIQNRIDTCLKTFTGREWEEFVHRARSNFETTTGTLGRKLEARKKYDKEQEELEHLRKEKADREQKDRDERIAKEATDRAEAEARWIAEEEAAQVKAEQNRAEQERQRLEREKKDAEDRAAKAEADKKAAEEQAVRDRIDAEARAEQAKKAEETRRDAERKESEARVAKAAEDATKREQERQAEEKRKEEKAAADREADKSHKKRINNEALEAIITTGYDVDKDEPIVISKAIAKSIISAIAMGKIPNVKIIY